MCGVGVHQANMECEGWICELRRRGDKTMNCFGIVLDPSEQTKYPQEKDMEVRLAAAQRMCRRSEGGVAKHLTMSKMVEEISAMVDNGRGKGRTVQGVILKRKIKVRGQEHSQC